VPAGTSVEIWARSADDVAGLDAEAWIGPFTDNPADFTMAPGPIPQRRYLQVELRLATMDRSAAPRGRSPGSRGWTRSVDSRCSEASGRSTASRLDSAEPPPSWPPTPRGRPTGSS